MSYSWSVNGEDYHGEHETRDAAAAAAIDDVAREEGTICVWTGRNVPFEPNAKWLAELVIDHISESGTDECGEPAGYWSDRITDDQKIALGKLIIEAVERICPMDFSSVDNVETHKIVK